MESKRAPSLTFGQDVRRHCFGYHVLNLPGLVDEQESIYQTVKVADATQERLYSVIRKRGIDKEGLLHRTNQTLYDKLKVTKSQLMPGEKIQELQPGKWECHWLKRAVIACYYCAAA